MSMVLSDVHLEYVNEVFIKVNTSESILMELSGAFDYFTPNYRYHPLVRKRRWNGKISLINRQTGICLSGLSQRIKKYCDERDYSISFDEELYYDNISKHEFNEHIKSLNLPSNFEIRDYQYNAALKSLKSKRRLLLSPTNSGKTLISYLISSWYLKQGLKVLYIVPTIDLVSQFTEDMYSFGYKENISTSYKGLDKSNSIKEQICVTTWQSLNNGRTKMPSEWYSQFNVVFGDESHQHAAKSVKECLENLVDCKYRFGMTGSLSGVELSDMTIEGLFGPQYITTTNKEMIKNKYSSKFTIKCIVLKYPEEICKKLHSVKYKKEDLSKKYHDEISFIINCNERNAFIRNLTKSLKGNRLVFFKNIEHGVKLKELLEGDDRVFHIDGNIKDDDRALIRHKLKEEEDSILVGSLGTTSTGISISRLHHMIAASPSKSKIKVLQSIGRMLRTHETKEEEGAILYDIVDDLSYRGERNYTLNHYQERLKIYEKEQFNVTTYNVSLKVKDE